MKKIYISADIEGIWGNSNPANTAKNGYLYSEYCTNMMNVTGVQTCALPI